MDLYVFWSRTCPHCHRALRFLATLETELLWLKVLALEVAEPDNAKAYAALAEELDAEARYVPAFFYCGQFTYGYVDDTTTGRFLRQGLVACYARLAGASGAGRPLSRAAPATPSAVDLPPVGPLDPDALSLPILTLVLALAANAHELLCTAGFPMVFTRVLTLAELTTPAHYGYLALYNLIFVLPLLAIVTAFVVTLGARKLSEAEGRTLKLLSGLMMLGLGLVLLLAPEAPASPLTAFGLMLIALALTLLAVWIDRHAHPWSAPARRQAADRPCRAARHARQSRRRLRDDALRRPARRQRRCWRRSSRSAGPQLALLAGPCGRDLEPLRQQFDVEHIPPVGRLVLGQQVD